MMLDGQCSAPVTWVLPTFASESGCSQLTPSISAPFPTPNSRDWKDTMGNVPPSRAVGMRHTLGQRVAHYIQHPEQSPMWPTPHSNSEQVGNRLNPTWVEWLMGWPIHWTDPSGGPSSADFQEWLENNRTAMTAFAQSATVRFHSNEPLPGDCSGGQ